MDVKKMYIGGKWVESGKAQLTEYELIEADDD
jgi:hypothetical protein